MKYLWFAITLRDCNGQILAMWHYNQLFPVTPPQFTYPNASDYVSYTLEFRRLGIDIVTLQARRNINEVIHEATQKYIDSLA